MIDFNSIKKHIFEMKGEIGDKAELVFKETVKVFGYDCRKSTLEEDKKHIDFFLSNDDWFTEKTVDVKSRKKISRFSNSFDDEWVWIEFQNVYGKPGWLYGKQDFIAFERPEDYLMVERVSLSKLCEELVDRNKYVDNSWQAEYCVYQRKNAKDIISRIRMEDIEGCVDFNLFKKPEQYVIKDEPSKIPKFIQKRIDEKENEKRI